MQKALIDSIIRATSQCLLALALHGGISYYTAVDNATIYQHAWEHNLMLNTTHKHG